MFDTWSPRSMRLLHHAVLAGAVLLTTGHRFRNDFVFDDIAMIVEGDVIHDFANLPRAWTRRTMFVSAADDGTVDSVDTYRPLTVTTFFVDAAWSGRSPVGYHFTGLLLHLLAVFGVAGVARRAFASRRASMFGALVFATHPWLVEAHVWINGRSDSLALSFTLACAFVLLGRHRRRHAMGALAFLAALLSKETALLLLPAIALLPSAGVRPNGREVARRLVALGLAASIYFIARVAVLDGARVGGSETAWAAFRVLPILCIDAVQQSVAPHDVVLRSLRDEYSAQPWEIAAAWLVLALIAAVVLASRKHPTVIAATAWFFAPLLPVAVIATVLWPGFGRYLYLGLPGWAWLLALGFDWAWPRWPRPSVVVAAAYVLVLGTQSALATTEWRNDHALYSAAIRANPASAMGYGWMGLSLFKHGQAAEAIPYLEQAVVRDPETHRYLARLGQALHAVGRLDDAASIAARGIDIFRDRPEEASYRILAVRSMTVASPEVAAEHLARCLRVWPGRRDCSEAVDALRRDPAHADALERALRRPVP